MICFSFFQKNMKNLLTLTLRYSLYCTYTGGKAYENRK